MKSFFIFTIYLRTKIKNMKTKILILLGLAFSLGSCSVKTIYQVVSTKSESLNDEFVYENEDVKCSYDLWNPKSGAPYSFKIYNKSESPIFLDWSKSSFIVNGESYDYFNEMTVTESRVAAKSNSNVFRNYQSTTATTSAVQLNATQSYKQKKIQYIPSKSFIECKLNSNKINIFNACDYALLGTKNIKEFNFEEKNTPLIFRNHLSYSKSENSNNIEKIDNKFWVNKILIMNEKTFQGENIAYETCYKNVKAYRNSYPHKNKNSFYT